MLERRNNMIETPRYVVHLCQFRKNCTEVMTEFSTEWGTNVEYGYSVKTNRDLYFGSSQKLAKVNLNEA